MLPEIRQPVTYLAPSSKEPAMDHPTAVTDTDEAVEATEAAPDAVVEEVLVEEVSIDGMCGVY
jgi:mycofactocin precursor